MTPTKFFDMSFWQGIVTNLIPVIVGLLFAAVRRWVRSRHPLLIRWVVGGTIIVLLFGLATYLLLDLPRPGLVGFTVAVVCTAVLGSELLTLSAIGVLGVDKTIASGLGYDRALRLCKNELLFLGVGAHKLTRSEEFKDAVKRCNRVGAPAVKLLLIKPSSEVLATAAAQAGRPVDEYQKNVRNSLEILKELRTGSKLNIEVRFHREGKPWPLFRMMFVDGVLCLLSYYVWGEGDGSQLPQLHLGYSVHGRSAATFYYPFRDYFNNLWEVAERWDFKAIP